MQLVSVGRTIVLVLFYFLWHGILVAIGSALVLEVTSLSFSRSLTLESPFIDASCTSVPRWFLSLKAKA